MSCQKYQKSLLLPKKSPVSVLKKGKSIFLHIQDLLLGIDEKATVPLGEQSSQVADTQKNYIHCVEQEVVGGVQATQSLISILDKCGSKALAFLNFFFSIQKSGKFCRNALLLHHSQDVFVTNQVTLKRTIRGTFPFISPKSAERLFNPFSYPPFSLHCSYSFDKKLSFRVGFLSFELLWYILEYLIRRVCPSILFQRQLS